MSIIIFLIILSILVFVHELGHFLLAKLNGIRVDSFALGFPPTIAKKKIGETTYKLNALPLGGYVSIYGENYDALEPTDPDYQRSFVMKKPWQQFLVLIAGIVFNIIFAWLVLIIVSWIGGPTLLENYQPTEKYDADTHVMVLDTIAESPADSAGITSGTIITSITTPDGELLTAESLSIESITQTTKEYPFLDITIIPSTDSEPQTLTITPETGWGSDESQGIGVALGYTTHERDSFFAGIANGARRTINMTGLVATGLWDLVTGQGSFDDVTGPVGLVGVVGDAQERGIVSLLILTAIISINLALLNLLPFPALDGGRIVFVIIETLTGKRIPSKIGGWVNAIGFGLLMLLMVVVTVKDVIHLF